MNSYIFINNLSIENGLSEGNFINIQGSEIILIASGFNYIENEIFYKKLIEISRSNLTIIKDIVIEEFSMTNFIDSTFSKIIFKNISFSNVNEPLIVNLNSAKQSQLFLFDVKIYNFSLVQGEFLSAKTSSIIISKLDVNLIQNSEKLQLFFYESNLIFLDSIIRNSFSFLVKLHKMPNVSLYNSFFFNNIIKSGKSFIEFIDCVHYIVYNCSFQNIQMISSETTVLIIFF